MKLADLAVTVDKLGISSVNDSKVAAGAGIVESKLSLAFGTSALNTDIQTRLLAATYLAHDHSLADPTQVDFNNLLNKYTDADAVAAVEAVALLSLTGNLKNADGLVQNLITMGIYGSIGVTYSSANFFTGMNAEAHQTIGTWPIVQNSHATLGARGILMDKTSGFYFLVEHGAVTAGDPVSTAVAQLTETGAFIIQGDLTAPNVVTAGTVDGVDVSAHAINDAAHHAKYTNAEAVAAVEAVAELNLEGYLDLLLNKSIRFDGLDDRRIMYFSGTPNRGIRYDAKGPAAGWYGQHRFYASYNAGALVLIATIHPNGIDINGDIVVSGDVDGVDVSAEKTAVDGHLVLGSANAQWINCPYEGASVEIADKMTTIGEIIPVSGSHHIFSVPLPTNRGGKKLYISGTRVSLSAADASNYVTDTYIRAYGASTATTPDTDPTDKNTVALHEDTSMGALDCSSYHAIKVQVFCTVATIAALKIQFITVRYYYA